MGSHTLEVIRQGLWGSVTGGWYFDPHQGIFCNTLHLYLWIILLCLPLTFYLAFPPTIAVWVIYSVVITVTFSVIKIISYRMHLMFDVGEHDGAANTEENGDEKAAGDKGDSEELESSSQSRDLEKGTSSTLSAHGHSSSRIGEDSDAIEMVELNSNRPNYHSGTSSRTRSRTASSNKSTKVVIQISIIYID
nr:pecanex-like protein 1 [Lytechinus pictus]